VFGSVAYVQRINTLGGRIPGNFYSIPKFQSTNNYALAIPFQARACPRCEPQVVHAKYWYHICHGRLLLASVGACEPACMDRN
jgi:hypothetical protein